MRKLFSLLLALVATTSLWAYDFKSGDLYYNITSRSAPYTVKVTYKLYQSSSNYSGLTIATIPETVTYNGTTYSVTSIGDDAFWGCESLTSITIPNSVTSIGDDAFWDCESLTSITIPNSVTSIGDAAFCCCTSFTSITIPNSVTSIGYMVFWNCSSLTSITIPNSVTSIGDDAFAYCSSLDTITCLAMTPPALGRSVFAGWDNPTLFVPCAALSDYQAHEQWGKFATIKCIASEEVDGIYYNYLEGNNVEVTYRGYNYNSYDNEYAGEVIIPSTVTYNGKTYSVTSIGDWAFGYCSSLTSVTIPNSVTSIGNFAFVDCTSLTSVTIGNSVTSIGNYAFRNCSSLDTLTCLAMTPPALGRYVFYGCDYPTLFVPCAALSDYQLHKQWGKFTTIECISSEEADTEKVVVESGTTTIQKILRDGQLIILRDGVEYNAMGQEIQ